MEYWKSQNNVYVYPSNFGWSDLGTWGSIYSISEKDENQNIISGEKLLLMTAQIQFLIFPMTNY